MTRFAPQRAHRFAAPTSGSPRRRFPTDGPAWAIGILSLLISAGFLVVNVAYNHGNVIPPVDDAYIHLQYAKQIGSGHFLQYNTGDPISTGASSLLYVLVLAAAYALGMRDELFLPFAMGFGALCAALTAVGCTLLGTRLAGRRVGVLAGLLVAGNGALMWGATSGMEVAFVALLLVALLLAFVVERPTGRFRLTPVIAVLAALTRTEAMIFATALCLAMVWHVVHHARGTRSRWPRALARLLWVGLPCYAAAAQYLFYLLVTGSAEQNGVLAKSLLHAPVVYPLEVLDQALTNLRVFLTAFSGLSTQDYVFPAALLLAVAGVVGLHRRFPQWRGLALASGAGVALVLVAVATLVHPQVHHMRYLQPLLPVLLLMAALGMDSVAVLFAGRGRRAVLAGLAAIALLFSFSQLPAWAIRQGQQAAGIRDQQVTISHWIDENLPPDAVVAVNDVGAAAYFGDRHVVDLIGLTTNGLAAPNLHGAGSLYEALRELPEHLRPDYFSIFDSWNVHGLVDTGLLGREVIGFELKSPRFSHITIGGHSACQAARGCDRVTVYEADWSLVGSGDRPVAPPPGRVRDHLDVADLADEERHDYRVVPAHRGFQPMTGGRTVQLPDGRRVVDSGRHVIGGEEFTARGLTPGRPATLTARVDATEPLAGVPTGSREVRVRVNGELAGTWSFAPDPLGWTETSFTLPAHLVTGTELRVELGPLQDFVGPYPDYTSYGYWLSQ
ncbi:hypothetical protein [Saccharopolyspora sp. CA-218241]|uniref:hypothetical protein n=1 Tax=Saccharopolyspora sp. CA-218241 TaxID=3240027 RepID=UPI003D96EB64